jgi:hypothetical protein
MKIEAKPIVTLCLCEQDQLILKPDTLYYFEHDPTCKACCKIYNEYAAEAIREKLNEHAKQEVINETLEEWHTIDELLFIFDPMDEEDLEKEVFKDKRIWERHIMGENGERYYKEVVDYGEEQAIHDGEEDEDTQECCGKHADPILEVRISPATCSICEERVRCCYALGRFDYQGNCVPFKEICRTYLEKKQRC